MKTLNIFFIILLLLSSCYSDTSQSETSNSPSPVSPSKTELFSFEGDTLQITRLDSLLWGENEMHKFLAVKVDKIDEILMKGFTDKQSINRSIRIFFFDKEFDFENLPHEIVALKKAKEGKPIATTFKINLGNKMVLFHEGFDDGDMLD
jgi:hypothetical protein